MIALAVIAANAQARSGDRDARLLRVDEFVLSPEADKAGIDGTITTALSVNKRGEVENPRIIAGPAWPCSSNPKNELKWVEDEVKKTLLSTKFAPAMKNGEPTDSDMTVTLKVGETYRRAIRERQAALLRKQQGSQVVKSDPAPPTHINGGVINGKARKLLKPEYPAEARSNRISGRVDVQVVIDENGRVTSAGAISGHPALHRASREAACDARFSPTLLSGRPVKVTGIISYNFVP